MRNYSDYLSLEEEYEELSQVCARQEAEIEQAKSAIREFLRWENAGDRQRPGLEREWIDQLERLAAVAWPEAEPGRGGATK